MDYALAWLAVGVFWLTGSRRLKHLGRGGWGVAEVTFSLREAVPEDVAYIARIIDLSGRQQIELDSFKGEQKVPCTAFAFPYPEEERLEKLAWISLNAEKVGTHYSRFKVAELDGCVAAGLCTFTREEDSTLEYFKALRAMGYSYLDLLAVMRRASPFLRAHPSTLKDALVVEYVATFPEFQKRGVITALLEDAIEKGRREEFPRMQVTTFIGNVSAQKAYEKVGFRVDKQRTNRSHEKLYGSPGMMRLTLEP